MRYLLGIDIGTSGTKLHCLIQMEKLLVQQLMDMN